MNSEQEQQRIMGYFIEEAREHLQTIEQGVLNLQDVLNDSESVNELFRAAHSIKGGAAMLGVGSIQHISHRLEDFFKVLTENPHVTVDERLKSLFLAGFDPLAELLDELQGGFKISDELTTETNSRVKPIFAELESYLSQLVSHPDEEISINIPAQEKSDQEKTGVIQHAQELVANQQSVFQQEVTTKMRDMLQLFRGEDTVESRSQLQAICNYFQEIGNSFSLKNWTNLVTQVKNVIAQPGNSYRILAPILIRELKESQDLVLSNRELEITVSAQLQNLLPYRFSESEEDEVSTIFTTASGNIAEESMVEELEIFDAESISLTSDLTTGSIDLYADPDVDIDLFADQSNEEVFDLSEVHEEQIDQMSWMDGEYEIAENQHIDGPKVGASELKSLAILFENDDIDFDAAWEDIESNETHMSNHGSDQISDNHDEFADLLDQGSNSNQSENLDSSSIEESSLAELFGDFSTDESVDEDNDDVSDSLFPEDIEKSWDQISEIGIVTEQAQSDLDELFATDLVASDLVDEFAPELGTDIIYQINTIDQAIDQNDDFDSLTSDEYFAELKRQENEEMNVDSLVDNLYEVSEVSEENEPFALTFSEEGMTLLDDPFAMNEGLSEVLLEPSVNVVSVNVVNDFDTIDSSELNLFDELGFDSDEFSEIEEENLSTSDLESDNDLSFAEANLFEGNFELFSDVNIDANTGANVVENIDGLSDFFAGSEEIDDISVNSFVSTVDTNNYLDNEPNNFFDINDEKSQLVSTESPDLDRLEQKDEEINTTDELDDFFAASEYEEQTITTSEMDNEINNVVDNVVSEDSFIDFDFPQVVNSNSFEDSYINSSEEFLNQINLSENSNVVDLLADANKDAQTVLEENDFDEERSLTQNAETNNLTNLSDLADLADFDFANAVDELPDNALEAMDEYLTVVQDISLSNSDLTVSSTIDNLADFFQGDDDSEISLLQVSEDIGNDSLTIESALDFGDFGEFSEFTDLGENRSITSNVSFAQSLDTKILADETRFQIEELNGIDDNFNFDDLEAMIGGSGLNEAIGISNHQITETSINDHQPANLDDMNFDDMNFDELEALLSDSSEFDTSISSDSNTKPRGFLEADTFVVPTTKPSEDFDELEDMLRDAFGNDVGPIKTKTPTRPPTTIRKQRDSTMRVDVKYLDSLNNLVGELVVNRNLLEQDQERLQQFITNLLHQVQLLSDVSQRMRDQYDRSLLEASLTAGRGRSFSFESSYANDGASSNSSVSSEFEGIEMDRYNTFHVLSQEIIELIVRVRESASDIEFVVGETDQVTRQLGTITTQVQDDLKQSRMVPFAQIADRLPRGIRDRALKTGKQAELEIYGRETLIDKAILEQLTDPLTHLVNNAIDHGLEDPHTRQAAGKSATGKLTVRTYHQGNQTVISISDDGAGISTEKVKKSAVSKRVRTQSEVDDLNDTEVYALLFEAGFSTKSQADEFSGRGVGLDVVKNCLDEIRGVIIVESTVGKGTTFTIRLPLTLSISKAMFCISDRARVAFPVDGFEDMVEVPQSQIVLNEKGQPCLPWRDTILPFQHLSNLLSYSRHLSRSSIYGKQENDELCIIILRNDTSYLALQVDQFLGEYEIVIKQLEGPIPQPAGIAGATVLGDGRVMAIANVLELFDIASGRLRPSVSGVTVQPPVEEDIAADPTVLIVDDSITVRELLSLTFAKVGYRVEQAKDGQDAWEKLRAGLPCDMIFCDIEMPRMDGLDLLSRLQKDSRLKDIPVAMLTSRGADRHRQSAIQLGAKGYFTKPYLEEELLSASKRLLNGETLPI
jgi:chemosensory pili system protein ChpA (sensor histidine kinase/response regulator)